MTSVSLYFFRYLLILTSQLNIRYFSSGTRGLLEFLAKNVGTMFQYINHWLKNPLSPSVSK